MAGWERIAEQAEKHVVQLQADKRALCGLLRDLIATIHLHTDVTTNQIDRAVLDPYANVAEQFLKEE